MVADETFSPALAASDADATGSPVSMYERTSVARMRRVRSDKAGPVMMTLLAVVECDC
jgi:hypothetical protein